MEEEVDVLPAKRGAEITAVWGMNSIGTVAAEQMARVADTFAGHSLCSGGETGGRWLAGIRVKRSGREHILDHCPRRGPGTWRPRSGG